MDGIGRGKTRVVQPIPNQEIDESYDLDGQTVENELGLKYRSFQKSVMDFVDQALHLESELNDSNDRGNQTLGR